MWRRETSRDAVLTPVARVLLAYSQDKRLNVLALFHESREPFLLKTIESAAAKRGVRADVVKDVVQSLVDDDLVRVDKVGTMNWYWSFPGEASKKASTALENASTSMARVASEKAQLEKEIANEKKKNPATSEREELSAKLSATKALNTRLRSELEGFSSTNPETVEAMRQGMKLSKQASNLWTDNVFMMKSWVESKMGDPEQVKAFFKSEGIDLNSFDYIE